MPRAERDAKASLFYYNKKDRMEKVNQMNTILGLFCYNHIIEAFLQNLNISSM